MKSSSKQKSNSAILKSPERATAESHRVWKRRYGWMMIWEKSIWLTDEAIALLVCALPIQLLTHSTPLIIDSPISIHIWFSHLNTYLYIVHIPPKTWWSYGSPFWWHHLTHKIQIRIHSFSSPKFNVPIWSLRQVGWVLYLLVTTELLAIHQGEICLFTSVEVLDR